MIRPAIEIAGLSKQFPKTQGYKDILTFWRRQYVTALTEIDLQVPKGGVFGLLGPNGAGKTTLLKILAGLVLPDRGQVKVNGVDIVDGSHPVGSMLTYVSAEERSHYWRLTGRENLKFLAVLEDIPGKQVKRRVQEVLDLVGLGEAADYRVGTYSSGMKQRLGIARGLLSESEILLLDEPTRSLDPLSAKYLGEFISEDLINKHGRTVVLATHNLEEASLLCDRVAILHRGQVRLCDSVESIAARLSSQAQYSITLLEEAPSSTIKGLAKIKGVCGVATESVNGHGETSVEVTVEDPEVGVPLALDHLLKAGAKVVEVNRKRTSLIEAITDVAEDAR